VGKANEVVEHHPVTNFGGKNGGEQLNKNDIKNKGPNPEKKRP